MQQQFASRVSRAIRGWWDSLAIMADDEGLEQDLIMPAFARSTVTGALPVLARAES